MIPKAIAISFRRWIELSELAALHKVLAPAAKHD
jgi:hypothetical protein